ncbi:MAG: NAD(+) kinase [Pseudomonadota bacterium]|nr:NAD(+) kinase [Pseudomonadota bacterium]
MFKSIGLIAKRGELRVKHCLETLVDYLLARQLEVIIDAPSAQLLPDSQLPVAPNTEALGLRCDLIIVIGGDGTLLQAARLLAKHNICLLGINLGRLGFLTDICPTQMEHYLGEIFAGAFIAEDRFLIYAEVYRNEQCLSQCNALNDIVIHRWNMSHMLTFKTAIDSHFVNCQRSDGLIVATPTGSTAYALSAGGPIIHPGLNALVLVTICPHTLSTRPIVVGGDCCVQVTIDAEQTGQAQLNGDGILCQQLIPGDRIVIEKRQHIRLIHPQSYDHYATLRAKLDWGKAV